MEVEAARPRALLGVVPPDADPARVTLASIPDPRWAPFTPERAAEVGALVERLAEQLEREQGAGPPEDTLAFLQALNQWLESRGSSPTWPWTSPARALQPPTPGGAIQVELNETTVCPCTDILLDVARATCLVLQPGHTPIGTLYGSVSRRYMGHRSAQWVLVPRCEEFVALKAYDRALMRAGRTREGYAVQEDPVAELRLLQEVDHLAHPNVIRLLAALETPTTLFAVFPWMGGGDLFERIADAGPTPEAAARRMIWQMFDAVRFLHDAGWAHRDISPENFMLEADGATPVLTDFGLAVRVRRAANSASAFEPVAHTGPVGKEKYMAPEVLTPLSATYDATAADVFSLGVTSFCLLTAKPPFVLASRANAHFNAMAVNRLLKETFRRWRRAGVFDFDLSEAALDMMQRMVLVEPAQRPTMDALMRDEAFFRQ